jgi:methyl-accepting chemotaxis protein
VRVTVAVRLVGLVLTATAALVAVAAVSGLASSREAAAGREMARTSEAMSRQWNADMMHDGIRADVMAALVARTDAQRSQFGVEDVSEHATTMLTMLDAAAAGAPAGLRSDFAAVRPQVAGYGALAVRLVSAARTDRAAAQAQLPGFLEVFAELETKLGDIDERLQAAVVDVEATSGAAAHTASRWILIAFGAGVGAFSAMSVLIVRSVVGPVRHIRARLAEVAAGDFTLSTDTGRRDELGDLARSVDATLASVRAAYRVVEGCTGDLTAQSQALHAASVELTSSAAQTSDRAGDSVALAQHVATSAGELAVGINQVASQSRGIAGSAATAAQVGQRAVDGAAVASEAIGRLGASSAQISGVASMIRAISDQTRLLALNATIEAARAGEAGRGFAVVASEVKNLAQAVGRATEDISARIGAIQGEVAHAVKSIDAVSSVVGEINAHQADITEAVEEQTSSSARVSAGIDVASSEAGGIVTEISVIADAAERTTATADHARSTADEIAGTARRLRSVLDQYAF